MDIVSMAFSNVSGGRDLLDSESEDMMSTAVSQPNDPSGTDHQPTAAGDAGGHDVQNVEMAEPSRETAANIQETDQQSSSSTDNGQIENTLPHSAIITVNERGEQIIELAQVVGSDQDQETCIITQPDAVETMVTETMITGDTQLASEDVIISENTDGLGTIAFEKHDVAIEPCDVVALPISLTDMQSIEGTVHLPTITTQVSTSDVVVTSGIGALSASSLLGSFANIIDTTSSVLNPSTLPVPVCLSYTGGTTAEPDVIDTIGSSSPIFVTTNSNGTTTSTTVPAQFIHNGTHLQAVDFQDDTISQPTFSHSVIATQASQVPTVVSASDVLGLPEIARSEATTAIGNRSVFSPMTLTIRTPPGAPAVNQALINSIVNNTEVQALLKRNPGQPITIVRVPEDSFEKRGHFGVSAKVVPTPNRIGRPKNKSPAENGSMASSKTLPRKYHKTKLQQRRDEEYIAQISSWKPAKLRTRSGRISRPPGYRTEHFKTLSLTERADTPTSDPERFSDDELDENCRDLVTPGGRLKRFKCRNCSKAYIGRGGLARHLTTEPSHGNIDEYEMSENASPKALEEVQSKSDELNESQISMPEDDEPKMTEGCPDIEQLLMSSEKEQPMELIEEEPTSPDLMASEMPLKGKKGRKPKQKIIGENNGKSEKRKETMRQGLRFFNNDDYIDVCLPRFARILSPWEFLMCKAELNKDDSSPVLKALHMFEELLSEVREMAVNCLEKVEDKSTQAEGIYLEEDDDLAKVFDFETGWYKVSEPLQGSAEIYGRYKFLVEKDEDDNSLKRKVDVRRLDEMADEKATAIKKRKMDTASPEIYNEPRQKPVIAVSRPMPKLGPHRDAVPKPTLVPDPKLTLVSDPKLTLVSELKPTLVPDLKPIPVPDPKPTLVPDPKLTLVLDLKTTLVPDPKTTLVPDLKPTLVPDLKPTLVPDGSKITPDPASSNSASASEQDSRMESLSLTDQQLTSTQSTAVNSRRKTFPNKSLVSQSLTPQLQQWAKDSMSKPLQLTTEPTAPPAQEHQLSTAAEPNSTPVPTTEITPPLAKEQQTPTVSLLSVDTVYTLKEEQPQEQLSASLVGGQSALQEQKLHPSERGGGDGVSDTGQASPSPMVVSRQEPANGISGDGGGQDGLVEGGGLEATADVVEIGAGDTTQGDIIKEDPSTSQPQEDISVVVPEGSTIMQMQDGTFLVQRPDGTAMQIHTPEGMTIETVQELLSVGIGQQ